MTATERSARRYARHRKSINRKRRAAYKKAGGKAGRRLSPAANQPAHDVIMTPPLLAQSIVDSFAPRGRLLDPCRGNHAFFNAMLKHSNDVHWCEITEDVDFFACQTQFVVRRTLLNQGVC